MDVSFLKKELRKLATEKRAAQTKKFFKTGPGEYAEKDVFLGVSNPDLRKIVKTYFTLSMNEDFSWQQKLLQSPIHEERLLALLFLVKEFQQVKEQRKKDIVDFYLKNTKYINNWDLVDVSAPKILGEYLYRHEHYERLHELILSSLHWERRIGVVANLSLIKKGIDDLIYDLVIILLENNEAEDLMHKASGWMLREAGKINSQRLEQFIISYGYKMPRTMLRYAIEKFDQEKRQELLTLTKSDKMFSVYIV